MCPICYHLREIRNRNAHDLDLDLWTGSMSNINMPPGRPDAIFYLLAIAMLALSTTVRMILTVEMCMTLTLTFTIGQGEM